jgi:hypothetical protein
VSATGVTTTVIFDPIPSATDLVSGSVQVTCNSTSGSSFPLGVTVVTCSATDTAQNTATKSFTVTVGE